MRTSRNRRARLEFLESRSLLNAAGLVSQSMQMTPIIVRNTQGAVALNGAIHGTWSTHLTNPDAGPTQVFHGTGRVKPLGTVQGSGTLHLPGFIARGQATGTFTLTNASGSITLQLTGTPQPGFSGPPSTLTYQITGGTGRYVGANGRGTATLTETHAGRPSLMPGSPQANLNSAGTFTLTFHAGH